MTPLPMILSDVITKDNVTALIFLTHNSGTAKWIFMKYGIKVMPLGDMPNSYFLISYSW
jgi:hypothetical protein